MGPIRRVAFRFACLYWGLFCIPILASQTPLPGERIDRALYRATVWVGRHLLGIQRDSAYQPNGSGDTTHDWIRLLCIAVLALAGAIVWSLVDRRDDRPRLREGVRVMVRYTLGLTMLGYGVVKLFGGQFPPPPPSRLLQTYGDSSPMGLLWTFMGASPAYVVFSSAGETLGAALLFFRRTTTLGALILSAVLTNVVMLNLCYDVPVKINSSHYLAMALYLLIPDARRLLDVLVLNRATAPVDQSLRLPARWMRITRAVAKTALVGATLILLGFAVRDERRSYGDLGAAPESGPGMWIEGTWNISRFAKGGAEVPPTRWRRLRLERAEGKLYLRWRNGDDSPGALYVAQLDEPKGALTLTPDEGEKGPSGTLTVAHADADHFTLAGRIGDDQLEVELARLQFDKLLLVSRGFHWISEEPFNR